MMGIPGRISKHRQHDPDNGKWIEGTITINRRSSLRKLMRAARRGRVPKEQMFVLAEAKKRAAQRADLYLNSHARGMKALRAAISRRA